MKLLGWFFFFYLTVVNDFQPLTDVTKNFILDINSVIIHIIIAISVTELHLKFI